MPGQGTVEDVVRCLNFAQDVGKQIKAANYQLEKADMKMLLADLTAAGGVGQNGAEPVAGRV